MMSDDYKGMPPGDLTEEEMAELGYPPDRELAALTIEQLVELARDDPFNDRIIKEARRRDALRQEKPTSGPRPYTEQEIRQQFIEYIRAIIEYWLNVYPEKTKREIAEGVAFSILVMLDGESANLPGFKVTPVVGEGDKDYYISRGENWYPDDIDIAGSLHEAFLAKERV